MAEIGPILDEPPALPDGNPAVAGTKDRILLRYLITAGTLLLCVDFFGEVAESHDSWFLLRLLIILSVFIVAMYLLTALLFNLFKLRWRRLISIAIAPIAFVCVQGFSVRSGLTAEYMHFVMQRQSLRSQIESPPSAPDAIRIWRWGFLGGVGMTPDERLVVFDPSGEIALEPKNRSADWFRRADQADAGRLVLGCAFSLREGRDFNRCATVEDFGGGFYMVEQYQ